jgi:hypothetical protein
LLVDAIGDDTADEEELCLLEEAAVLFAAVGSALIAVEERERGGERGERSLYAHTREEREAREKDKRERNQLQEKGESFSSIKEKNGRKKI